MKHIICNAQPADMRQVMEIVHKTGFFRPSEEDVAREVFDEAARNKAGCTYLSYVAHADEKAVGWICFGATPCTSGTFDIYWIAVDPDLQGCGIGSGLLHFAENEIVKLKGRIIVIETSGAGKYQSTHRFYEKNGYSRVAEVPDFYAPKDSKIIFTKQTYLHAGSTTGIIPGAPNA